MSDTDTWTAQDFERWLAQLAATSWQPTDPQTIARIRAELRRGATLTVPVPKEAAHA